MAREVECMIGSAITFVALLLLLILVPLHFSYIERQHVGFKKNSVSNEVDTSTVYYPGTHAWGVGKTSVQFSSKWEQVNFRGSDRLTVFTDAGEIAISVSFYYRIDPARLQRLYSAFGLAYDNRVRSISQAELRNAATNFTTREYQEERIRVADGLYTALSAGLTAQAEVLLNRSFFFLERIELPRSVLIKRQQVFANAQLQTTQDFNRTATQTRLDTRANETTIRNQADIINRNATLVAERLRANARAEAFRLVQREAGTQLATMRSLLNVTRMNSTDLLLKFNLLLDTDNVTLLSGVSTSVIQRT